MKRLMTLQWYIYDQRLPTMLRPTKAVTDSKNSKETVVSTHRSTTSDKGRTRWTESAEIFIVTRKNAINTEQT